MFSHGLGDQGEMSGLLCFKETGKDRHFVASSFHRGPSAALSHSIVPPLFPPPPTHIHRKESCGQGSEEKPVLSLGSWVADLTVPHRLQGEVATLSGNLQGWG
jgi:hypothetical protein